MKLENSSFRFKKFELTQQRAAMKVGTDGVLLGAWTSIANTASFLDVGAGTGVIALMLAQRNELSKGACLEPDHGAFQDLQQNIKNSPYTKRISAINLTFQNYEGPKHDLIVSNPPYFLSGNAAHGARGNARHAQTLPYSDLLRFSMKHLNYNGRLSVILPFEEGGRFIDIAPAAGLFLSRHCVVYPNESSAPVRRLIELGRRLVKVEQSRMCIRNGADLSDEFKELTSQFYLDGNPPEIA